MRKLLYPSLRNGLVGAWCPSLGPTGFLLLDRSRNNHGTLTNMDPGSDWVISNGRYALDFDGSNDSVVMATDLPDLPQWSVSAWARWPAVAGGAYSVLFAGKFGSVSGNGIGFHSTAGHAFLLRGNAVPANRRISVTSGQWFNAIATFDGTTDAIYVDGVAATTGGADSGFGITNTRIGHGFSSNYFAGQINDIRVYSRVLSQNEIKLLGQRPGIAYESYSVPIVRGATVGGAFTLTADQGSFALTGQDAGLLATRLTVADVGSFALTGQDAGLLATRLTVADVGSFALTGQDAGLLAARLTVADFGSFALNGQDATLTYGISGAYTLAADHGSFLLNGQDAGLLSVRILTSDLGSFALNGQDAGLLAARLIIAAQGSLTLTGQDSGLLATRLITAAQGSFTLTGQSATLSYSGEVISGEIAILNWSDVLIAW